MKKSIFTLSMLAALVLNSCKETAKQENSETTRTEETQNVGHDISTISVVDSKGKKLNMSFDDDKVTVVFNGETLELFEQKAASGIWYTNENYELNGKGDEFSLLKDGKTVFTNVDDTSLETFVDSKGNYLDLHINWTKQTAKLTIGDATEEINLIDQQPANGYWFKNDHYEFRGKGEQAELTKDGEIIFKN